MISHKIAAIVLLALVGMGLVFAIGVVVNLLGSL